MMLNGQVLTPEEALAESLGPHPQDPQLRRERATRILDVLAERGYRVMDAERLLADGWDVDRKFYTYEFAKNHELPWFEPDEDGAA